MTRKKDKQKRNKFQLLLSYIPANNIFKKLESNKLFIGLMMIIMNITSRYVELKFTKGQEALIRNIAREIFIFVVAFIATRELITSLIITAVFIILANFVFNETCKFNILPKRYKNVINEMDLNNDGKVSDEEIKKVTSILKKIKKNNI